MLDRRALVRLACVEPASPLCRPGLVSKLASSPVVEGKPENVDVNGGLFKEIPSLASLRRNARWQGAYKLGQRLSSGLC